MMHQVLGHRRRPARGAKGFSLIELLLAIFILGVGVISVAAVFPAGIIQQRRTQDDAFGPVVAEAALSTIRSRLSQDDFGTFEEFGLFGPEAFATYDDIAFPNGWLNKGDAYTQAGDWPWIRPSIAAVPRDESPDDEDHPYAGDIDVFSARVARANETSAENYPNNMQWDPEWSTSEFILGTNPLKGAGYDQGSDPGAFLYGIPFNRSKFDFLGGGEDPLVDITQEERFWPSGSGFAPGLSRPQYAWDCMFRRFQGRVQVAIFVYRLNVGNAAGGYAVCKDDGGGTLFRDSNRPPLPARVDLADQGDFDPDNPNGEYVLVDGAAYFPLDPLGDSVDTGFEADRNVVRRTYPNLNLGSDIALDPYFEGWQSPGQWLIDPYGRTHRVLQGRRNKEQGPVRLSRPVPNQAPNTAYYNPAAQGVGALNPEEWRQRSEQVRSLWFVPPVDRRGISLTPIYVSVRDL